MQVPFIDQYLLFFHLMIRWQSHLMTTVFCSPHVCPSPVVVLVMRTFHIRIILKCFIDKSSTAYPEPPKSLMPAAANAVCAPPPIPPQKKTSAFNALRTPANAPCPLPFVSTTSECTLFLPLHQILNVSVCPKCWKICPFSYVTAILMIPSPFSAAYFL